MKKDISFRPITRRDFSLIQKWLAEPHIEQWWNDKLDANGVEKKYGPRVDGLEPTYVYIILHKENPIGLIQWYLWSDYQEHAAQLGAKTSEAGMDLAIGEKEYVGKGIGSEVIREFAKKVVFADSKASALITDPEEKNLNSLRAFQRAGFVHLRTTQLRGETAKRAVISLSNTTTEKLANRQV